MSDVNDPDLEALVGELAQRLSDVVWSARPEIDAARAAGGPPAAEALVREMLTNAIDTIFAEVEETYGRQFAAGDAWAN